jgi:hypothetical protein
MTFPDPIPNEPTEVMPTTQAESDSELPKTNAQEQINSAEYSGPLFQAVGIVIGIVKFADENKSTLTIGQREYPLFYAPRKQRAFEALKKEIEATGEYNQRLVVYPKVIHFPRREQTHQIAFQLVGFDKGREEEAISGELQDLEFKISGLWQFIPVCPTPCISVFRNFTRERLDYIKQAEPAKKVKFMKASHLPVLWRDGPVRPFRFNPKAEKEQQGHPAFVSIKAKFLPHRDVFGFVEQLGEPLETAPKFLKASKQDKAIVQSAAKARGRGVPSRQEGNKLPTPKPRKKL